MIERDENGTVSKLLHVNSEIFGTKPRDGSFAAERRCAMKKIRTSVISGAALLGLAGTASAGPMSVASPQTVKPQAQIEQIAYRHHYRHYRHYGWYRRRYYHRYYGWNPAAAAAGAAVGLATLPFAVATGWPYYGYPYYW
jgi:hypothetical protein